MTLAITAPPVPLRTEADGTIRVSDTRVTLDIVIAAFQEGASPEEIVQQITVLDLVDVYAVLAFYLYHRTEVDAYLAERQQQAANMRAIIEARWSPVGVRERLLARRQSPEL